MSVKKMLGVVLLTTALALVGLDSKVHAATMVRLTEAQLLEKADWVGFASVNGTRTEWINKKLFTIVELQVSESVKGDMGATINMVVPGGMDMSKGLAYVVPGMPTVFPKGARMLVFGQRTQIPGALQPVGFSQGMIFISKNATGEDVVVRSTGGVELQVRRGPAQGERTQAIRDRLRTMVNTLEKGETR